MRSYDDLGEGWIEPYRTTNEPDVSVWVET
jgi:hypothetical protein